jgi:dTDP-4-amino-4,6-dideoxygalactose transaminase
VTEVGYKYHMNDIEAAIGLVQLKFLDADNARRLQIAQLYREGLADVPGIKLLCYEKNRMSSNHLFCILAENRNELIQKLNQNGINVSVHYQRNDTFPMYEKHDLPNTEYFCNHVLSLPMHLKLTDQEIEYIINQIRKGW